VQRARVLAVDGPGIAPWNELVSQLRRELGERGVAAHIVDARDGMAAWETIRALTIFGPGAALSRRPAMMSRGISTNPSGMSRRPWVRGPAATFSGAPPSFPTRRLFYVDRPILDRHRETIAPMVSLWIDAQTAHRPTALEAATLVATAAALVRQPFRTRTMFNTTAWGGYLGAAATGYGHRQA